MTPASRTFIAVALIALALGLAGPPLATRLRAEVRWAEIQRSGVLRVGIDPNWAPFSYYGPSGWTGVDADTAEAVARRLGLAARSEPVGYDSMYDALGQGRVDVLVSAVVPDPLRAREATYTSPYFDAGLRLAVSGACSGAVSACLENRRVAAALGTDADRAARYWERRATGMSRIPVADDIAAIEAMRTGRADAAIVTALDVWAMLPAGSLLLQPRPYVFAVRSDNARLAEEIDAALRTMERDGVQEAILTRWLAPRR